MGRGKTIVIGRKGTGKTAIAKYLSETPKSDTIVSTVNFTAVDLPSLPSESDLRSSTKLTQAWMRYLLMEIAECAIESFQGGAAQRAQMRREIGLSARSPSLLSGIKNVRIDAAFLGGLEVGLHRQATPEAPQVSIDKLFDQIAAWVYQKKIFLLVDGLDQGYIQTAADGHEAQYYKLIGSLIRAASEIRNNFRNLPVSRQICPIIFVRSDIFDNLWIDDKNKLEENQSVRLNWTAPELERFCRHRVHAAAQLGNSRVSEKDALSEVFQFKSQTVTDLLQNSRRLPLTEYIVDQTLVRPRDVVMLMRAAANFCIDQSTAGKEKRIDKVALESAKRTYGVFLKNELVEELKVEFPVLGHVLNRFSGAAVMSFSQFRSTTLAVNESLTEGDLHRLAERLFVLGFFGQLEASGSHTYALKDDQARFNETKPLVVHPCYARALNLAT